MINNDSVSRFNSGLLMDMDDPFANSFEDESVVNISSPPTSSSPSSLSSFRIIKFKVPNSGSSSTVPNGADLYRKDELEVDIISGTSTSPEDDEEQGSTRLAISTPVSKRPKRSVSVLNHHPHFHHNQLSTKSKRLLTPATLNRSNLSNKYSGSKSKHSTKKPTPPITPAITTSINNILKKTVSPPISTKLLSNSPSSKMVTPLKTTNTPIKSSSGAKKEKGAIRIQEMPTYISDMRAFIQEMKSIKLRPWFRIQAELSGIGFDPCSIPNDNSSCSISSPPISNSLHSSSISSSSIIVPVWIRSDGGKTQVKKKELKEYKPELSLSKKASSNHHHNHHHQHHDSDSVIQLLGILLKNIPTQPISDVLGYTCEVPRCGKRFIEKEKYRRHLHNHVRTIKHQQARGAKSSQEDTEGISPMQSPLSLDHAISSPPPLTSPLGIPTFPEILNVKLYALQSDANSHITQ